MKKKNDFPTKINAAALDLPGLSRVAHKNMGFTVLEDKVIIICDRSFAERLLDIRHDKALPPS